MTIVLRMSTDADIVATTLDPFWNPVTSYSWNAIANGQVQIPDGSTIVVIAHGNGTAIGNAGNDLTIDAAQFLDLIRTSMAPNAVPAAIYLSTCSPGISQFTAAVRLEAEKHDIWHGVRLFGHDSKVAGSVPPATSKSIAWTQIF